jgi:hypothetical protein
MAGASIAIVLYWVGRIDAYKCLLESEETTGKTTASGGDRISD